MRWRPGTTRTAGWELHDKLGELFNLKPFLAGNTGAQSGGWYRERITRPEDFNGLRIRMPGLGGEVLSRLGAELITLPGAEVYGALASQAIDATEWVGPWADERAGFRDLVPYYYTAGFHEPGGGLTLAANRMMFDELSPAHQKIIETAAAEVHQWSLTLFLAQNSAAFARMRASGLEIVQFPESVWDALADTVQDINREKATDPLFRDVLTSYKASMKASSSWLSSSEMPYRKQRDRVMS